ncbi:hypothetical protein GP486_004571 [Trichoglossum hirsutum]|uniref:Uncharacterized protein n=1 Tax=Trichoglossum hirsutum TaxID=265104 RepID=A0A9P8RPH5_9PEZI|nr:hypothetical protein GP486_004571 [Trichoglossum hirsutum]
MQHQALRSVRNVTPQKLWTRRNKSNSNLDANSVSDPKWDSGYSSYPNLEAEARYYDQMMEKFKEEGPTLSNPGKGMLDMMQAEKFCEMMGINAEQTLIAYKAKRFKAYLIWRVNHLRVKKESTIITYWKVFSIISSYLTPHFDLNDSEKEKACLFVDDLSILLNCHWVRDTKLFLVRIEGQVPTIAMKLSFKHIKRSGGKSRENVTAWTSEAYRQPYT